MIEEQVSERSDPKFIISIPTRDRKSLEAIRRWIFDHTGLNYPPRKEGILYSRLQSLCWHLGMDNLHEIEQMLNEDGSEWLATEVARSVSTNYTFFLREKAEFDFLKEHILPGLPDNDTWRIWSAAASSGEEAYTVAILLAETFGQERARQKAAILGTDLNYRMVEQAECGIYPEQRLEKIPKGWAYRYFNLCPSKMWQISDDIRQMCTFRRLNLMSNPWPFKQPFHLILCRNIFYYFDKTEQLELVERLYDATVPGGWLLTSVTETFHAMPVRWKRITTGIWRKF